MAADSDARSADALELAIEIDAGDAADAERLEELTSSLRRQLLELDVDAVERPAGSEAPEGTKAIEAIALGALVVRLAGRRELLAGVANAVRAWLGARPHRSVKLSVDGDVIEVSGVSSEQQERLIDAWLERQAGP